MIIGKHNAHYHKIMAQYSFQQEKVQKLDYHILYILEIKLQIHSRTPCLPQLTLAQVGTL